MSEMARLHEGILASEFDLMRVVTELRYGTDAEDIDIVFDSLEEMWDWRRQAEGVAAAARKLIKLMDSLIAQEIGDRQVRLDDSLLRVKPKRTLRVYAPDALFDYLEDDARHCFRADDIRITSLRAIVEKRAREANPDITADELRKRVESVVNCFIDHDVSDDAHLEVLPMSKAPKFAASLEPGVLYDDAAIKQVQKASRSKKPALETGEPT